MFHPVHTFINKTVTDFDARPLLQDIFVEGQQVYQLPDLEHIKAYATNCLDSLWDEYKRDLNPKIPSRSLKSAGITRCGPLKSAYANQNRNI